MSQKTTLSTSPQPPLTVLGSLNVLIHGLFFMELNNRNLEILAPVVSNPHDFLGGVRGRLADLKTVTGPIDWTKDPNLAGKKTPPDPTHDLPATILQFSRTTTGVVGFKPKDPKRTIILPWPKTFFSLRFASISNFTFTPQTGIIGNDILRVCRAGGTNDKLSVVTGLSYDYTFSYPPVPGWTPNLNFHFYLNPQLGDDIHGVNQDLQDASNIFLNNVAFDLKMDENATYPKAPLDNPNSLPDGINVEDELSLDEPVTTPLHRDVFEMLKLILLSKQNTDARRDILHVLDPMVNPANCPNFFVQG